MNYSTPLPLPPNYPSPPNGSTAPTSQMQQQHERLMVGLHGLHESLAHLESRLEPLLHPPYPPAPTAVDKGDPVHVVQMAAKFSDGCDMVEGAITRVQSILSRIEV